MNIKTNKHEYIEQNGCHLCKYMFVAYEHNRPNEYYCLYDSTPKCKSGQFKIKDGFNFKSNLIDENEDWHEWAKLNSITLYGICKQFEELD